MSVQRSELNSLSELNLFVLLETDAELCARRKNNILAARQTAAGPVFVLSDPSSRLWPSRAAKVSRVILVKPDWWVSGESRGLLDRKEPEEAWAQRYAVMMDAG